MKKRMLALCVTAAVGISACSAGGEAPTTEAVQESETTATETTAAQADTEPAPEESASGTFEGKGNGFGGELQLKVTVTDGKMEDIEVVSHHESSVVFNRALPIITERILEAQSPEVDSVTGATFTSYAVKAAVAEAMKEQGTEFGEINCRDHVYHPGTGGGTGPGGGCPYPAGDRRRRSGRTWRCHYGQGERA